MDEEEKRECVYKRENVNHVFFNCVFFFIFFVVAFCFIIILRLPSLSPPVFSFPYTVYTIHSPLFFLYVFPPGSCINIMIVTFAMTVVFSLFFLLLLQDFSFSYSYTLSHQCSYNFFFLSYAYILIVRLTHRFLNNYDLFPLFFVLFFSLRQYSLSHFYSYSFLTSSARPLSPLWGNLRDSKIKRY